MAEYGPLEHVDPVYGGESVPLHVVEAWATCPSCACRMKLDGDQYRGEVSVDCPECEYHETYDHR